VLDTRSPRALYAYQMLVLDELDRLGCQVQFTDAPAIDDDPQARLLTQMQGVIAEYERAVIAERYRRGKLFRVRAGEAIFWKVPYGYRRVPRTGGRHAFCVSAVGRLTVTPVSGNSDSECAVSVQTAVSGIRSPKWMRNAVSAELQL
jgi:Resolvase, N terminal domain